MTASHDSLPWQLSFLPLRAGRPHDPTPARLELVAGGLLGGVEHRLHRPESCSLDVRDDLVVLLAQLLVRVLELLHLCLEVVHLLLLGGPGRLEVVVRHGEVRLDRLLRGAQRRRRRHAERQVREGHEGVGAGVYRVHRMEGRHRLRGGLRLGEIGAWRPVATCGALWRR